MENVDTNGVRRGIDMNARTAWSITKGAGVTIAIVDDGVDLHHPDLVNQQRADLHWHFDTDTPNGAHSETARGHGTAVTGLAVAQSNNAKGISGLAPEARFASWVIYQPGNTLLVTSNKLAKMFDFNIQDVQIQNHSWVIPGRRLTFMSAAESAAISNAVVNGRGGKGVVIVRASGNDRDAIRDANYDAYTADPRVITASAVSFPGVATSYGNPGAPILVCAPSGDPGFGYQNLFTTDRVGVLGYNNITFPDFPDLNDYVFGSLGFNGTSAAAPLISAACALVLSANPDLTYRDVQHILLLSARQLPNGDVDLHENGAGLVVSHNTGYGLVNAGNAVDLARRWTSLPKAVSSMTTISEPGNIPDAGLKVLYRTNSTDAPVAVAAFPSFGKHPNTPTPFLPLVYVGNGQAPINTNLTGKAALISNEDLTQTDPSRNYAALIQRAALAGAEMAVIMMTQGGESVDLMRFTDFVPIPAVIINQVEGEKLRAIASNTETEAMIQYETLGYTFHVADPLISEHVLVHANFTHEYRGDLRVTLVSPQGTRSVLSKVGIDRMGFTGSWSFMSTHHFYEASVGDWRLEFGDEAPGAVGSVQSVTLEIQGIPIVDEDADGLDDDWETGHFGSLKFSAKEDPDNDGYSNAREQIMRTNPAINENTLAVGIAPLNQDIIRLNWPAKNGTEYEILAGSRIDEPLTTITNLVGAFPRTVWFLPVDANARFFKIREK